MEQAINFAIAFFGGAYLALVSRSEPRRVSLKRLASGVILVLVQLVLNAAIGGFPSGDNVSPIDALLLREMSYNCAFAVLGYSLAVSGFVGLVMSLVDRRSNESTG